LKLPKDLRRFLTVFAVSTLIFTVLTYTLLTPRPRERFFQLYILGENHRIGNYYPGDDPNLHLGEDVKWYLGIVNNMGSVQYVMIKLKIGNRSMEPPNEEKTEPAQMPTVIEYRRFLSDNETFETPIQWTIMEAEEAHGVVKLTKLKINNETVLIQGVEADKGENFRFVLELWSYDPESRVFMFGWRNGGERKTAWLQLWFNITTMH
jgi:uncharacterized membrane protein